MVSNIRLSNVSTCTATPRRRPPPPSKAGAIDGRREMGGRWTRAVTSHISRVTSRSWWGGCKLNSFDP